MQDFNSDAHVEEWMAKNGGIDALRHALNRGTFAGQNKSLANAWLLAHDRKQVEQKAAEERALLVRSVTAAERAARFAMWAAIVAVIAVIVTVVRGH